MSRRGWLIGLLGVVVLAGIAIFAYARDNPAPQPRFCAGVGAVEQITGATPEDVVRQFVQGHGGDPSQVHRISVSADATRTMWDVLSTGINADFDAIAVVRDGDVFKYDGACVNAAGHTTTTSR